MVSELSILFNNNRIFGSQAVTTTISGASAGSNAIGGALAIVAGAFVYSFYLGETSDISWGTTTVQDSRIAVTGSSFTNCTAVSFTGGPTSSSIGTTSVYGGAVSLLHSPQVSIFGGTSIPALQPPQALQLAGFNVTFSILSCSFIACSAVTNSS